MKKKIRVAVVFGGRSGEHEVSLASARSVLRALDHTKYEIVQIGITKEGRWLSSGNALAALVGSTDSPLLKGGMEDAAVPGEAGGSETPDQGGARELVPAEQMIESVSPLRSVDVVFPVLHGPMGEDGTIQGLLELADLPYVGAGVAASAVGMDKQLMKDVFCSHGLPVADYQVLLRSEWEDRPDSIVVTIEERLGYPCFVKPANLGSSVGITKAHDRQELAQALTLAAQYDRKLIVERCVDGREVECSVLGNDKPIASVAGEIIPEREFYDYVAKYNDALTRLLIPADIGQEKMREVQELAIRAFRAIDCSGMARVDFFIERGSDRVILNEINTIPGFTAVSMYPKLWEASGLSYPDLVDRLIELALERHQDKSRSKVNY